MDLQQQTDDHCHHHQCESYTQIKQKQQSKGKTLERTHKHTHTEIHPHSPNIKRKRAKATTQSNIGKNIFGAETKVKHIHTHANQAGKSHLSTYAYADNKFVHRLSTRLSVSFVVFVIWFSSDHPGRQSISFLVVGQHSNRVPVVPYECVCVHTILHKPNGLTKQAYFIESVVFTVVVVLELLMRFCNHR